MFTKKISNLAGTMALSLAVALSTALAVPFFNQKNVVAQSPAAPSAAPAEHAPPKDEAAVSHANSLSRAFRYAAMKASPAVVKISSQTKAKTIQRSSRQAENPFKGTPFEDMLPDFDGEMRGGRTPAQMGVGSGVIIDADGLVLTNNHVVEGADNVTVRTSDGREFEAIDIKTDPSSDLAVLHLKGAKNLTSLKLGNSDEMEIGDWVIAIGNPFELETTVSAGIISGKGRELGSIRRSSFLQTDAAINPGNSGGPLVNLDGEVIGINTAIASNSGGYQGIGFAIPSNQAHWVVDQLVHSGKVQRAYMGVGISPLTADLAAKFGVPSNNGVLVNEVMNDSPAAVAGLKDGDVVLMLNNKKLSGPRDLQEGIEHSPIDSTQKLLVLRDGKQMTIDVKVMALPDKLAAESPRRRSMSPEQQTKGEEVKSLGITVSDMNASQKRTFAGIEGVAITNVDEDGPAAEKGVAVGTLIRKVGHTPVTNVKDFKAALDKELSQDGVVLELHNEQGNHFVVLKPKAA